MIYGERNVQRGEWNREKKRHWRIQTDLMKARGSKEELATASRSISERAKVPKTDYLSWALRGQ